MLLDEKQNKMRKELENKIKEATLVVNQYPNANSIKILMEAKEELIKFNKQS